MSAEKKAGDKIHSSERSSGSGSSSSNSIERWTSLILPSDVDTQVLTR